MLIDGIELPLCTVMQESRKIKAVGVFREGIGPKRVIFEIWKNHICEMLLQPGVDM
jgi:hypothetical protein